ncbi:PREDICTED: uncharacterized protein LOC109342288 [Lupinus angustifolius]|uniref:uncharacterized protein LOC109342288 n=1 Tax=Lupinus angustifolius TaxID=3871 RepID=UPI00092EBB95|nr:PREDICTED: uncharacterized protein LOC109342288 [Lupinus angustifolius]
MDGYSGYHQIKMAPEDIDKTTFITPWEEHVTNLRKLFERLRRYQLKLNPAKCSFGVRSGKVLGFIVSQKGIEVDPKKIRVIVEMPVPRTEKEVRGFLGRLNYISRFSSQLTATLLISLENKFIPITARLCFDCTNNIAEYEACVLGLEAALESRIKSIEVFGDSALVIHQVKGEWETRDTKLVPYRDHIQKLIAQFEKIDFYHIPREDNRLVDALATSSSMFQIDGKQMQVIRITSKDQPAYCYEIESKSDGKP